MSSISRNQFFGLVIIGVFLAAGTALGQEARSADHAKELSAAAVNRLKAANPEISIQQDRRTGFPGSIQGLADPVRPDPNSGVPTDLKARAAN
jgi:hypothetical protein